MRFHGDFSRNYPDDPIGKTGIGAHAHRVPGDVVFLSGPPFLTRQDADYVSSVAGGKPLLYLHVEEPNYFFVKDWRLFPHEAFHRVYTLCPYTAEWLNEMLATRLRVPAFFPIDRRHEPPRQNKRYDVVYAGSMIRGWISDTISELKRYRHAIISHDRSPLATHRGVSYAEKLALIAQAKVSLIHNLLFLSERHLAQVRSQPGYEKNHAFTRLEERIAPQLKSRLFEAALCRSLILCRHDPWNLVEQHFEPDRDFLYFRSNREMHDRIGDVSQHFERYEGMIESAYRKVVAHRTPEAFLDLVVRPSL